MKKLILSFTILFSFLSFQSHAEDQLNRSYRLGLSQNFLHSSTLSQTAESGSGITGTYEFNLTPKFALGVNLEYRRFAGTEALSQMGYGLIMKHSLASLSEITPSLKPYVEYGLLMNVSRIKTRPNSGSSHDTKLAIGANFKAFEIPAFIEVSHHISRLSYFEQEKINLDYMQICLGWTETF